MPPGRNPISLALVPVVETDRVIEDRPSLRSYGPAGEDERLARETKTLMDGKAENAKRREANQPGKGRRSKAEKWRQKDETGEQYRQDACAANIGFGLKSPCKIRQSDR